jgi:glycosyltransferase involved in cell wall biosynthesis
VSYKILYWDQGKSSFVKKDLEILRTEFEVIDYTFRAKSNAFILVELFKQALISLYHVLACKIVVCQFSGYHSLVPFIIFKIFGRKRIIIAGGTDCVAFPSIKYGNFQKKYLKWFTKKSFQLANVVSPVDETLIKYSYTYQANDYKEQGYRAYVKNMQALDRVIYNGYDFKKFRIVNFTRKENSFLTVAANLNTQFAPKLKGIDLIIEIARDFTECVFTIIGGDHLQIDNKPNNLMLIGNIDNAQLVDIYNDNKFYLQLSMSEGFPNALCEAMLCGCIPIVSNVGAMPKIVSEDGIVLERKDISLLKTKIETAINLSLDKSLMNRNRDLIKNRFTIEKRQKELVDLMISVIK